LISSTSNLTDLNTSLYGSCDANASAVYVSLDNQTFEKATKGLSTWESNITLKPGSNIVYLREDFKRGDFSHQYSSQAEISVDPSNQVQNADDPGLGILLLIIGLAMLLAVAYVMVKRKK
jgi:hypothetical protein